MGSNLTMDIYSAPIVQYEDTFLIVGGVCNICFPRTWLDTIYQYDNNSPDGGWILRTEKLNQGRANFGAVLVDDEIAPCENRANYNYNFPQKIL